MCRTAAKNASLCDLSGFSEGFSTCPPQAGASTHTHTYTDNLPLPFLLLSLNPFTVSQVVHEMLVTSEGCELYLLGPKAFGFTPGEELAFAEVQEVGRLLRRTCIGVVSDGVIELVPDNTWRWKVQENDRIAAIADSW